MFWVRGRRVLRRLERVERLEISRMPVRRRSRRLISRSRQDSICWRSHPDRSESVEFGLRLEVPIPCCFVDRLIDISDRNAASHSAVTLRIAIAEFERFRRSGGRARRDRADAHSAALQSASGEHRGPSAAVQYFSRSEMFNQWQISLSMKAEISSGRRCGVAPSAPAPRRFACAARCRSGIQAASWRQPGRADIPMYDVLHAIQRR